MDGDDVRFGGNPAFTTNTVDLSISLASLSFAADSQLFQLHVAGDGGKRLAFSGLGIQNLTATTGPIRQQLFADAGATGGTILFANTAGINLGSSEQLRPVDITALGGVVAGASGGEVIFRNSALATPFTAITVTGGTVIGAAGGQLSFQDSARVQGNVNLAAGADGGQGGRATFRNAAIADFSVGIRNSGASFAGPGTEALTSF
jgi:hypothetical protein